MRKLIELVDEAQMHALTKALAGRSEGLVRRILEGCFMLRECLCESCALTRGDIVHSSNEVGLDQPKELLRAQPRRYKFL